MAQSGQSLPAKMAYIYAPLDKAQLQTGYLYDQAPPIVSPARFRGSLNAGNAADINRFGAVYAHILNSKNTTDSIPDPSVQAISMLTLAACTNA